MKDVGEKESNMQVEEEWQGVGGYAGRGGMKVKDLLWKVTSDTTTSYSAGVGGGVSTC